MHASRGLIALLVATVAFFALWVVALKPGGSSTGGSPSQGLSGYQSAIAKAHQTVQNSAVAAAQVAGEDPSSSSSATTAQPAAASSAAASPATSASHAVATQKHSVSHSRPSYSAKAGHGRAIALRAAHRSGTPASRLSIVQRAMHAHKVVALLFYNPAGADDQAVKQELGAVATHRGRVVKLTIPLTEIANYTAVTQQVPVNLAPTLVLIAPNGQADEIVGFTTSFEVAQRVDQALAAR